MKRLALFSQIPYPVSAQQLAPAAEVYEKHQYGRAETLQNPEVTELKILECLNKALNYEEYQALTQ